MPAYKIYPNSSLKSKDLLLDQIETTIEKHVSDPYFGVDQLAHRVHLSRSQLTRKLRLLNGTTPGKQIQHIRLQHASECLRKSSEPIKNIAINCGFLSYQSFWKAFIEVFNLTPTDYRALYQNEVSKDHSFLAWTIPLTNEMEEEMKHIIKKNRWLADLFILLIKGVSDESITLNQLADALCLSPSQLIRKLKVVLGTTPMKLLQHIRLLLAADLLTNESVSISQIAYQVGFFDQSHFCTAFRKAFDSRPLDYRRKNRKTAFFTNLKRVLTNHSLSCQNASHPVIF